VLFWGFKMWRTPSGERILQCCEWRLFREGLSLLWDQVEESVDDPDLCMTGVRVFDRLEPPTKLAMLALVGSALHDDHEACPKLTALTEGTFAAIYAVIRQWIDIEIDSAKEGPSLTSDPNSMRNLVLAAYREAQSRWKEMDTSEGPDDEHEDEDEPPSLFLAPDSEDCDAWADLLDELMDQVLWGDRDFEEEDVMLDLAPDLGRGLKSQLGIDDDYFTGVAPEPYVAELAEIRGTLRKLSGRPERE
jgi:hypothetical protein